MRASERGRRRHGRARSPGQGRPLRGRPTPNSCIAGLQEHRALRAANLQIDADCTIRLDGGVPAAAPNRRMPGTRDLAGFRSPASPLSSTHPVLQRSACRRRSRAAAVRPRLGLADVFTSNGTSARRIGRPAVSPCFTPPGQPDWLDSVSSAAPALARSAFICRVAQLESTAMPMHEPPSDARDKDQRPCRPFRRAGLSDGKAPASNASSSVWFMRMSPAAGFHAPRRCSASPQRRGAQGKEVHVPARPDAGIVVERVSSRGAIF